MTENAPAVPDSGAANTPILGGDAATVRATTTTLRTKATREMESLRARQAEARRDLEEQRKAVEAEFRRKERELMAQMEPLKAELAKLTEVAWTVDLYLGRDEDLTLIRDGQSAPLETPITIRQKVLSMAEESLVLMDRKVTGMDADNIDAFVAWLLEAPENLDRILPEEKGVVVLVPTWVKSRSGNIYEDVARDEANQTSWWLIRNGERLYLLTVDPALRIGERLLPKRDEFTEVFEQRTFGGDVSRLKPGSDEWMKAEARADARRRHYMRVMLVLQGIVDRTPAWHPLPPGGVNLMSLDAQRDGKVRIIQDADQSIQLGDGRETFDQWQRRLNALLRPGLRVVGNWGSAGFGALYERGERWNGYRGHHPRITPRTCESRPASDVPHLIEERRGSGFVIRFTRTDEVWRRNVPIPDKPGYVWPEMSVPAARRASCVIERDDTWVLPYDLVTEADLRYYLNSRESRSKSFLDMVPTIRAALATKKAEAEIEAPFRVLLADRLIDAGADQETIADTLDELVTWWKSANTWTRPLNGEPKHEAKALRQIVAEFTARQRAAQGGLADQMVKVGRTVPGAICVAVNRQGAWFAYAPSPGARDAGVFLDVTPIRKDGTLGEVQTWRKVQQRTATALQVAWSAEAWAEWNFAANASHYLTEPERAALIDRLTTRVASPICITEAFNPANPTDRSFAVFGWRNGTPSSTTATTDTHCLGRHDGLVEASLWKVVKKPGVEPRLELVPNRRPDWNRFSGGSGSTIPWWPTPDLYPDRPRLAWSDEALLTETREYAARCEALVKAKQAERIAFEKAAYVYSTPVCDLIRAQRDAAIHDRFVEDFGPDAEDLWPAHLKSLGARKDPIHPRDVWGLVACSLKHGQPVAGRTLDELADFAASTKNDAPGEWRSGTSRIDTLEYGSIVVPELEPDGVA